jgi:hypothetical protein
MRALPNTLAILAIAACGANARPLESSQAAAGTSATSAQQSGPSAKCIAEHPPTDPFDFGEDPYAAPSEPGGPVHVPLSAEQAVSIADGCREDHGTVCDLTHFISKQAADCIARAHAFEAGLSPWKFHLRYYGTKLRVVWEVQNLESVLGTAASAGSVLVIDATLGTVLEMAQWQAIP